MDRDSDSLRTPCFVVGERQIVLPAFGEFTGGSLVSPGEGERALIATDRGVFDVTPRGGGRYGGFRDQGSTPASVSLVNFE